MRRACFDKGTITHYRIRKVGEVFFTEERERYFAELFGESSSSDAAFDIGRKECRSVLEYRRQCDKYENCDYCNDKETELFSRKVAVKEIGREHIEKSDREHKHEVSQCNGNESLYHTLCAIIGKRIFMF